MLNIPVNSSGHVGMLPPFHGAFTQNEDVIRSTGASNITIKLSHKRLLPIDGLILTTFPGQAQTRAVNQ